MAKYVLTDSDLMIVAVARTLLARLTRHDQLRPAELVSVAKLQHALSCVPQPTTELAVTVNVTLPRRDYDNGVFTRRYCEVAIDEGQLTVSCGGYLYQPDVGGDSFTSFAWTAVPGQEAECLDYRYALGAVPDLEPFDVMVASMDFRKGNSAVEVFDPDNSLLDEVSNEGAQIGGDVNDFYSHDQDSAAAKWDIHPLDHDEQRLAQIVDAAEVDAREPAYAYGADRCDICGRRLDTCGMFVDGRLRGDKAWGNLCAGCFDAKGDGVGWGDGQLYARQHDGRWRLVAGFPPDTA